ncbi:hypothetical protein K502DRAFT_367287 [Neoconidiobolus thromboides FSU 785]|nr:hypothetical protein K502DRAFT_367287 [Neoconidiobolus thromboides FSU 785]
MTAHTQVELKIKCQDLPDLDYLSKSDPQVFLLVADPITQQFDDNRVKAYTEVIKDNLNPEFSKSFILDYIFEIPQKLRFIVVDVDKFDKNDWREQEYIGRFDCTLSQIASSQGQRLIGALHNERRHSKKGTISIFFEELEESKFNLKLIISASNIPKKKSFFGSSYPRTFVTISKSREDLNWVIVHKTEIKDKIPNPCWAPIESILYYSI